MTAQTDTPAQAAPHSSAPHAIAYRASSSLLGRRFYLAIFMGVERRAAERTKEEGEARAFPLLLLDMLALIWLLFLASVFVIGLAVVIAYLIKSSLGIDLFDGPSGLHRFFFG